MKFFQSFLVALILTVASLAQYTYPTGPNTGAANTPYSTNSFSATFNGPVGVTSAVTPSGTSTNLVYTSNNVNASETVIVRSINHDIPVDYTSSDYYANDDNTGGTVKDSVTARGTWGGHPFTYTYRVFTGTDGRLYSRRTRYIIVNAREAIFISQTTLESYDDQNEWLDFEYSLRIN